MGEKSRSADRPCSPCILTASLPAPCFLCLQSDMWLESAFLTEARHKLLYTSWSHGSSPYTDNVWLPLEGLSADPLPIRQKKGTGKVPPLSTDVARHPVATLMR